MGVPPAWELVIIRIMRSHLVNLDYERPSPRANIADRFIRLIVAIVATIVGAAIAFVVANVYGSIRAPEVFLLGLQWTVMVSAITTIIALILPELRGLGKLVVFLIILFPSLWIGGIAIFESSRQDVNGPSDRFRELLQNPIPSTVHNIQFIPLAAKIETDLFLRFTISSSDFDRIIQSHQYSPTEPYKLFRKNDRFNDANYLRIAFDDELYQARGPYGEVHTIRVNREHTSVVFRYETSFGSMR